MKSFGQLISEQPVHDKLDQLTHNIPLSKKRLKQMAQPSSLSLKFDFDSWQGYHPPSNSSKVVFDEIQYLIGLQEFRDQWETDMRMHDTKVMKAFRNYVDKHDLEVDLDRIKDISTIYSSNNWQESMELMQKYQVKYIYIGDIERHYYPAIGLEKFKERIGDDLELVYSNTGVDIYEVN